MNAEEFPSRLRPTFKLWLERGGKYVMGEGGADLLEAIRSTRSISGAARKIGMSYKYAWDSIDEIEGVLGQPVIEARRGGSEGGKATLTVPGELLLDEYRKIQNSLAELLRGKALRNADLTVIGSHCIGVDILMSIIHERWSRLRMESIVAGSIGGLLAIKKGEADVAGIHLLHRDSGEYNLPFLRELEMQDTAVLVRGYWREQVLITSRGNPKRISSIEDLTRPDVTMVNRATGSGTRSLLDMSLADIAIKRRMSLSDLISSIKGYETEARSHIDVALAVLYGKADVGMGTRTVADRYNLDFVPVREERFDFAVRVDRLKSPPIRNFLEVLRSERFRNRLVKEALGLKVTDETGALIG